MEEAASTLGASPLKVFAYVTLPNILPGILAGSVVGFAKALGEFGATITFVSNIPGETQTIASAIYALLQVPGEELSVLRMIGVSIFLSFGALVLSEFLARKMVRLMTVSLDIKLRQGKFLLDAKLNAPPGMTVIFGPSGSGKTTLLRVIAGLETASQGHISIDGVNLLGIPPHRRAVGYVFQEPRLMPHLNVLGNLKFPQRMSGGFGFKNLEEVIDLLELEPC